MSGIRAKSYRNIFMFLFIGMFSVCLILNVAQKLYGEFSRITLAQRLGVNQAISWNELEKYYDCSYVPVGIHASDLFLRSSQLDVLLVKPPSERIPFQAQKIELDLSYPVDVTIHFDQFSPLNRAYRINKHGIVTSVSEIPTYYGVKTVTCSSQ
jgi:hypothetical protein